MDSRKFYLGADEIEPMGQAFGSCLATDRIVVDGQRVGYMYREDPDNSTDSGWRFFAGDESDEYANNPDNLGIYDVNTIANYDPRIIPLLARVPGEAFVWDSRSGKFEADFAIKPPDDTEVSE